MATTIVGQCCRLLNLISGFKHLKLPLTHQPGITRLSRPLWTGAIFDAGNKETVQVLKNFSEKPKMPANVFVTFLQKVTADIMKDNPGMRRPEIVRQASLMWQDLNPEEKSRLTLERKELFEKYKEDMKAYLDNMTPEQIQAEELRKEKRAARRLKSLRKQLGMPKKPVGSFGYFVSEKFPEYSGQNVASAFKLFLSEWAEMSDAEKEKYRQKAREDGQKYKEDIVKWEKEMVALGRFDVVRKKFLHELNKNKKSKPSKKKSVGFSAHDSDSDL
ncbi:unnamed protein product [Candidula unifasciata]|uniref:HMG box domain-containing protein n=1 Tax=Candidula unifasciata TaxID=100452 RepID=A0A8S3YEI7_9EUPU|nr:unnamed protein product [Candidula unifasciata]